MNMLIIQIDIGERKVERKEEKWRARTGIDRDDKQLGKFQTMVTLLQIQSKKQEEQQETAEFAPIEGVRKNKHSGSQELSTRTMKQRRRNEKESLYNEYGQREKLLQLWRICLYYKALQKLGNCGPKKEN